MYQQLKTTFDGIFDRFLVWKRGFLFEFETLIVILRQVYSTYITKVED